MKKVLLPLIITPVMALNSWAGQISDPNYSNDFTSSASDFTTNNPGATDAWVLNTGAGTFGYNASTAGFGDYTASVQDTLLGGSAATATSFNFRGVVDYVGPESPGSSTELGLTFLGDGDTPTDFYNFYIKGAGLTDGGSILLVKEVGGLRTTLDVAGGTDFELRDYIGNQLTYDVTGTYVGSSLSITATFSSNKDANTFTLTHTDSDPLTANFFSLYSGAMLNRDITVNWNEMQLTAVPEPQTVALLSGVVALGVAAIYRRRQKA